MVVCCILFYANRFPSNPENAHKPYRDNIEKDDMILTYLNNINIFKFISCWRRRNYIKYSNDLVSSNAVSSRKLI